MMNLLYRITSAWNVVPLVLVVVLGMSLGCGENTGPSSTANTETASEDNGETAETTETTETPEAIEEEKVPEEESGKDAKAEEVVEVEEEEVLEVETPKTEETETPGENVEGKDVKTETTENAVTADKTFGEDAKFLKKYLSDTIVLTDESGEAKVAVVPAYQGRVMTSSAKGDDGASFGWINYEHIESKKMVPHMNPFGGEERFWIGPEGGQFCIFFEPDAEFKMDNWQTPPAIDSEPYKVVKTEKSRAEFTYETKLTNYSKTEFALKIDRAVEVLSAEQAAKSLGVDVKDVAFVGYRTENRLTNTGKEPWSKETGLLSIWLLGMYKHSPETTVVVPFKTGEESELGPIVNDSYFGKVPAERLKVAEGVMYFSADGKYRSKIGLTPQRSKDVVGSYDAVRGALTIVKYNKPGPEVVEYVNSMWQIQDKPFAGDTVNSYNDGPNEMGTTMGPFYELETSSPALALKPGETGTHTQETYHFQGDKNQLDAIAKKVLGVSIDEIESGLK